MSATADKKTGMIFTFWDWIQKESIRLLYKPEKGNFLHIYSLEKKQGIWARGGEILIDIYMAHHSQRGCFTVLGCTPGGGFPINLFSEHLGKGSNEFNRLMFSVSVFSVRNNHEENVLCFGWFLCFFYFLLGL